MPRHLSRMFGVCVLLAAALLFASDRPTYASGERIRNLDIVQEGDYLLVSAQLVPGLPKQTEDDIHNGISKDLYYYVALKRRQKLWIDAEKTAVTVKYSVKFNLLKQEYTVVTRLPSGTSRETFTDFDRVRERITKIVQIPLVALDRLKRRKTYLVSVKGEMRAPTLPLYLDYFLFFIPFVEMDTPWAHSSPFRIPDAQ